MFRNVLVPVDRSAFAETALPFGAAIARRNMGALHIAMVHAISVPDALRGAPVPLDVSYDLEIRRQEQEYLEALAARVASEYAIQPRITLLDGQIAGSIEAHARAIDADLVVMSTHGRGGIQRAWLGSVADRLLRSLSIPALLIRPTTGATLPEPTFRNVLVGLDGSALSEGALRAAGAIAGAAARCTALRVAVPPLNPGTPYIPDAARVNRAALEATVKEAREYVDGLAHRIRGEWASFETAVLPAYHAADVLLEAANELKVDLIAIATHGRGPIVRAIIGSVADKVIRGATQPVLVVPEQALVSGLATGHGATLERDAL